MLVLIDGGKIVFQQSKDDLLDTFRVVKGNAALLNDQNKKLIRSLKVSSFGFTGITDQAAEVKRKCRMCCLKRHPSKILCSRTLEVTTMIANLVKRLLLVKSLLWAFRNQYPCPPACDNPYEEYGANTRYRDVHFLYMVILMELSFMQAVATEEEKARKQRRCFAQPPIPEKAMLSQNTSAI